MPRRSRPARVGRRQARRLEAVRGWRAVELDRRGHAAVSLANAHHHAAVHGVRVGQRGGHVLDRGTGYTGLDETPRQQGALVRSEMARRASSRCLSCTRCTERLPLLAKASSLRRFAEQPDLAIAGPCAGVHRSASQLRCRRNRQWRAAVSDVPYRTETQCDRALPPASGHRANAPARKASCTPLCLDRTPICRTARRLGGP